MKPFRLNRRAVLRGAGSIAIALPWLECMETKPVAAAGGATTAQRFVTVYQPGGTVLNKWTPTGSETDFTLGPILSPLNPVKDKLMLISGLDMKSAVGEQHQAGIIAWLTGTSQGVAGRYAQGPSVDQVIATRISRGQKPIGSLQLAVRWGTGKAHGLLSPISSVNFEDGGSFDPIAPRLDPQEIWSDLFGSLDPGEPNAEAERIARKRSILDYVDKRYTALSQRMSGRDRIKLEEHLDKIREMEQALMIPTGGGNASCSPPELIDTSDYNPKTGLNADNDGQVKDQSTDAAIPRVGKLMTDMMVMALACDLTAVASFQWSDTEAKHTFPWLNLSEHHHFYQHDGGFRAAECEQIATWYSQQHLYLIEALAGVTMGDHTLLDETVVFFGSELQDPPVHAKNNMPFMLAGNGGGLRTGRWLRYNNGRSHNDLLVSILNLFGDTRTTFGNPEFSSGPLSGPTLT
jgi:hypothetical protein